MAKLQFFQSLSSPHTCPQNLTNTMEKKRKHTTFMSMFLSSFDTINMGIHQKKRSSSGFESTEPAHHEPVSNVFIRVRCFQLTKPCKKKIEEEMWYLWWLSRPKMGVKGSNFEGGTHCESAAVTEQRGLTINSNGSGGWASGTTGMRSKKKEGRRRRAVAVAAWRCPVMVTEDKEDKGQDRKWWPGS